MTRYYRILIMLTLTLFCIPTTAAPLIPYETLETRTHKTSTFTQGLQIFDGEFYESSGLYGQSFLARYPIKEPSSSWEKITAPFTEKSSLANHFFAEGLTFVGDKIYLLTWREKTLHIFSIKPFKLANQIRYDGEGWGLTYDQKRLIRSDGSSTLYFHHPDDFRILGTLSVSLNGVPLDNLNELEFANGFIYANVWHQNNIAKIDPASGEVVGVIDLSDIAKQHQSSSSDDVLNGIAWDEERKGFWITGKRWSKMYLIRLKENSKNNE